MSRDKKSAHLEELDATLATAKGVVFANYQGLKVNEVQALRDTLSDQAMTMRVTKNTILRLALRRHNIAIDEAILTKPLAMVASASDEIAPAKALKEFAKDHEALGLAGGLVGPRYLAAAEVKALANLPSTLELRAQLVGLLASPISGLLRVLQGPSASLVSVLKQYELSRNVQN